MVVEKLVIFTIILVVIALMIVSFCIGYIMGFKKMKEIDDKILNSYTRCE